MVGILRSEKAGTWLMEEKMDLYFSKKMYTYILIRICFPFSQLLACCWGHFWSTDPWSERGQWVPHPLRDELLASS